MLRSGYAGWVNNEFVYWIFIQNKKERHAFFFVYFMFDATQERIRLAVFVSPIGRGLTVERADRL